MVTHMNDSRIRTVEEAQRFLDGTLPIEFSIDARADRYRWIQQTLVRLRYTTLGKKSRGVVLRYLERVSGYSRAQIKRLVKQYVACGRMVRQAIAGKRFVGKYTAADVVLLAATDALDGQLCGAATKKTCERMFTLYGDRRYERLAGISISHLYNLRHSEGYRRQRRHVDTTTAPPRARCRSASGASPPRTVSRGTCASTPCTRVTSTASRGSITSTRSMRSRSSSACSRSRASASASCGRAGPERDLARQARAHAGR